MKKHYNDDHLFRSEQERYMRSRLPNWKVVVVILVLATLYGLATKAQTTEKPKPVTKEEIQNDRVGLDRLYWGYQTSIPGWVVKKGDTLQLGKGSLPNKDFAFIYTSPTSLYAHYTSDYKLVREYLRSTYNGKRVIVKELMQSGTKRVGYTMNLIVNAAPIVRNYIELDNAIDAGEVLPPVQYRPSAQAAPAVPVSVADELIKLKSLLDAGAITQTEYDSQKKKLLGN